MFLVQEIDCVWIEVIMQIVFYTRLFDFNNFRLVTRTIFAAMIQRAFSALINYSNTIK